MSVQTIGILTFFKLIFCSSEVLGSRTPITINGIPAFLTLPSLPSWVKDEPNPLGRPLVAPPVASNAIRGDSPLHWGMPERFPTGESMVKRASVEFQITPEQIRASKQEIYRGCAQWVKTFESYVSILIKNYGGGNEVQNPEEGRLELLELDNGKINCVRDEKRVSIISIIVSNQKGLNLAQLSKACTAASNQQQLKLQYRMLLEAIRAMNDRDWRKTIVDAACAVELALTDRVESEITQTGLENAQELMSEFRTLGKLYKLAKIYDISFPTVNFNDEIAQIRNKTVHKGSFPSRSDAYQFLKKAELIIETITPEISQ